jgi:hypothetical protein
LAAAGAAAGAWANTLAAKKPAIRVARILFIAEAFQKLLKKTTPEGKETLPQRSGLSLR